MPLSDSPVTLKHRCRSLVIASLGIIGCWIFLYTAAVDLGQYGIRFFRTGLEGRWPLVFILGVRRSGTASLAEYLREHIGLCGPYVEDSKGKLVYTSGVQYFDTDINFGKTGKPRNLTYYLSSFGLDPKCSKRRRSEQVYFDASPDYFADSIYLKRMCHTIPEYMRQQLKMILVLREPVSRDLSWYEQQLSDPRSISEPLIRETKDYRDYVTTAANRQVGLNVGYYDEALDTYLKCFSRHQLFIINFDTLVVNGTDTMRRILRFLDIKTLVENVRLPHLNPRPQHVRNNSRLDPSTCGTLAAIFGAHNQRLYKMLSEPGAPTDEPKFIEFDDPCALPSSWKGQVSIDEVGISVEFSDAHLYGSLGAAVCTTYLNFFPHAIIYTDAVLELPPGSPAKKVCSPHIQVVTINRPDLNTSIIAAQRKREEVLFDFAHRFTYKQRWRVSTEQDTWWSIPRLLQYLDHVSTLVGIKGPAIGQEPRVLVGAGGEKNGNFAPFIVMTNTLLDQLFGTRSRMETCVGRMLQCVDRYPHAYVNQTGYTCSQQVYMYDKDCRNLCSLLPYAYAGTPFNNDHIFAFCMNKMQRKLALTGEEQGYASCFNGDGCVWSNHMKAPLYFFWQNKRRSPPSVLPESLLQASVALHHLDAKMMKWLQKWERGSGAANPLSPH